MCTWENMLSSYYMHMKKDGGVITYSCYCCPTLIPLNFKVLSSQRCCMFFILNVQNFLTVDSRNVDPIKRDVHCFGTEPVTDNIDII